MVLFSNPQPAPASSQPRWEKKRRAAQACSCCRARKIRCDMLEVGFPCTKCRIDRFDCVAEARKKRRARPQSRIDGDVVQLENNGSEPEQRIQQQHSHADSNESNRRLSMRSLSPRNLPKHFMLHHVPHYPFLLDFTKPRFGLSSDTRDQERDLLLPLQARDDSGPADPNSHQDVDDNLFLRRKGALDLPPRPILDEFVSAYFRLFHPFFPIIDKTAFLQSYHRTDSQQIIKGHGPSLLLLQAVLFTASSVVSIDLLKNLGFTSRKHARRCLHRRTRYLYDFDFECDDIATIQALLLMSHYFQSMVEQKHTWHWVHQAVTLAQGAGLHRDPGSAPQRCMWSRIWWACLVRDRLTSLGTLRPMHINSLDCDVPMLTPQDLEEPGDQGDERAIKLMFIEFVKLCQYMEGVLSLQHMKVAAGAVPGQVKICEDTLQHWLENLVPDARLEEESMGVSGGHVVLLYRAVLHLMYNTIVIALQQTHHHQTLETGNSQKQQKVESAALASTQLVTELVERDLCKYAPTISVTAVLSAVIVHLQTIRSSPTSTLKKVHISRYNRCMVFLREVGDIYWHASFYHEFFELAASSSRSMMPSVVQSALGSPKNRQPSLALATMLPDAAKSFVDSPVGIAVHRTDYSNNYEPSGVPHSHAPGDTTFESLSPEDLRFQDWLEVHGNLQNIFPSA